MFSRHFFPKTWFSWYGWGKLSQKETTGLCLWPNPLLNPGVRRAEAPAPSLPQMPRSRWGSLVRAPPIYSFNEQTWGPCATVSCSYLLMKAHSPPQSLPTTHTHTHQLRYLGDSLWRVSGSLLHKNSSSGTVTGWPHLSPLVPAPPPHIRPPPDISTPERHPLLLQVALHFLGTAVC